MSEESESWQQYKSEQKERRQKRLPIATEEIMNLESHGFIVKEKTPYQFRINDVVDVYPTHRRFHVIKSGKRGNYSYGKLLEQIKKLIGA